MGMSDMTEGEADYLKYRFKQYLGSVSREIQNRRLKEQKMGMKFEIGKTYEHQYGTKMTIIGRLQTRTWGECLIGEEDTGVLRPVSEEEENFDGWRETI